MQGQGTSTDTPYPQAKNEVDQRSECSTNLNNAHLETTGYKNSINSSYLQDGNNTVPSGETLNNTDSPRGHSENRLDKRSSSTKLKRVHSENRIDKRSSSTELKRAKNEVDQRSECSTNLNNAHLETTGYKNSINSSYLQDGNNTVPSGETLNNTDSPRGENKDSLTNRISVRPNCNARDENELKQTRGNPTSTDCYQGGSQANKGHENTKTTAHPQAKNEVDQRSECSTNLNNAQLETTGYKNSINSSYLQDGNNTVPSGETLNNTDSPRVCCIKLTSNVEG
ncbi:hypothetical protein Aperf_G00000081458 [Anoplocephala perfoliata]